MGSGCTDQRHRSSPFPRSYRSVIHPCPLDLVLIAMASESIKKVQGKLFRGEGIQQSRQPEGRASPGLAIHIPPITPPPPIPNPPPKLSKLPLDGSPKSDIDGRPYRERLVDMLGADYHGVERYRLLQDEKRDRHWKRWGPYLSERQWVNLKYIPCWLIDLKLAIGHRPRGLLCQW